MKMSFNLFLSFICLITGFLTYILRQNSESAHMLLKLNNSIVYNFIKYNLTDFLWCLSGCLLIHNIWEHKKKYNFYLLISIIPLIGLGLEGFQLIGFIPGTFDWIDIGCYIFCLLILIIFQNIKNGLK